MKFRVSMELRRPLRARERRVVEVQAPDVDAASARALWLFARPGLRAAVVLVEPVVDPPPSMKA